MRGALGPPGYGGGGSFDIIAGMYREVLNTASGTLLLIKPGRNRIINPQRFTESQPFQENLSPQDHW